MNPVYIRLAKHVRTALESEIPHFPKDECGTASAVLASHFIRNGIQAEVRAGWYGKPPELQAYVYVPGADVHVDITRDQFPNVHQSIIVCPSSADVLRPDELATRQTLRSFELPGVKRNLERLLNLV